MNLTGIGESGLFWKGEASTELSMDTVMILKAPFADPTTTRAFGNTFKAVICLFKLKKEKRRQQAF